MPTSPSNKYIDVFMSYRREGGSAFAGLLHRELSHNHFSVFLDTKTIESGEFDAKIKTSIERSSNFVFLLTPGSLRRCFEQQGRDFVLEEIALAHSIRQSVVAGNSKERADGMFRVIPVFLGEELSKYLEFKESCPDVWKLLNAMFGDEGHNGIKLSDASSFESELNKLMGRMLQKPSGKFVSALIDRCVSEDDGLRQSLDELFSSYLDMYEKEEYSQIRDHLSPLVNDKLLDILETNDFSRLTKALGSFRLSSLKDSCVQFIGPENSFGSRDRVVGNLGLWLNGDLSIPKRASAEIDNKNKDRLFVLRSILASAVRSRKWMSRETLVGAIKESLDGNAGFSKYQPANWKQVSDITDELFEHFSYTEICEFLENKLLTKAKLGEMQKHIWSSLQLEFKNLANLRENAASHAFVTAIETFLRYEKPYELCKYDLEILDAEVEDTESENESKSAIDQLVSSLLRIMRGHTRDYHQLVTNYLADNGSIIELRNIRQLLISAIQINRGEFLVGLSAHGLSRNTKFRREDWKKVCGEMGISGAGTLDQILERIRVSIVDSDGVINVTAHPVNYPEIPSP